MRFLYSVLFSTVLFNFCASATEDELVVPTFTTEHPIIGYLHDQLKQALAATSETYGERTIVSIKMPTEEERQLKNLNLNITDLAWATCTAKRNKEYRAVMVPQIGGLFGIRLNVIRNNDMRFTTIRELSELAKLVGVQSSKWPDYRIMLDNGLKVLATDRFAAYRAVAKGIADYYPRGVGEITSELEDSNVSGLSIAPSIALKYPMLFIIYVRKGNEALAKRLEQGFKTTIENGEFMALMQKQNWFHQADNLLRNREFIQLKNHLNDGSCADTAEQYKAILYQPSGR